MRNRLSQESSMNDSVCNSVFKGENRITDDPRTWWFSAGVDCRSRMAPESGAKCCVNLKSDSYSSSLKSRPCYPPRAPPAKRRNLRGKKERNTFIFLKLKNEQTCRGQNGPAFHKGQIGKTPALTYRFPFYTQQPAFSTHPWENSWRSFLVTMFRVSPLPFPSTAQRYPSSWAASDTMWSPVLPPGSNHGNTIQFCSLQVGGRGKSSD